MRKLAILLSIVAIGCTVEKKGSAEVTYWVNSTKVDCVGVGPIQCLQIKKGGDLNTGTWENFYSKIEGFDYVPGYIYKLIVKEEYLDIKNVPADAFSIKYTLIEQLSKDVDKTLRINDIWLLEAIGEENVSEVSQISTIEINVSEKTISGKPVCNTINGKVETLTATKISFGQMISTKMMCRTMQLERKLMQAFSKVKNYEIRDNKLFLMNGKQQLITFKKVD